MRTIPAIPSILQNVLVPGPVRTQQWLSFDFRLCLKSLSRLCANEQGHRIGQRMGWGGGPLRCKTGHLTFHISSQIRCQEQTLSNRWRIAVPDIRSRDE